MILSLHLLAWLIAALIFLGAFLGVPTTKYSLIALGLFFLVLGLIFP